MAESKKRAADSEGTNQMKKPKFEKKSGLKNSIDKPKGGNPFQKTGTHTFFFAKTVFLSNIILQYFTSGNKQFGKPNKFQKPQGKFQKSQGKFRGKFQKPAADKFGKPTDCPSKPAPAPEKVDWTKFKQEKRELRLKRKATKTGFDKIQEAKQLYEKLKW